MLEPQDLQSIGQIMDEKLAKQRDEIVGMVGEMVEQQVLPRLDALEQRMATIEARLDRLESRLDRLEARMSALEGRVDRLDGTVANLPTKAYLDDKLADTISDTVRLIERRILKPQQEKERIFQEKMIEVLRVNNLASPEQLTMLQSLITP